MDKPSISELPPVEVINTQPTNTPAPIYTSSEPQVTPASSNVGKGAKVGPSPADFGTGSQVAPGPSGYGNGPPGYGNSAQMYPQGYPPMQPQAPVNQVMHQQQTTQVIINQQPQQPGLILGPIGGHRGWSSDICGCFGDMKSCE